MYQFEYNDLEFGKGALSELISYDRYVITSNDIHSAKEGDVVIFIKDKEKNTQLVGAITHKMNDVEMMEIEAHDGSGLYNVAYENARLVKELKPSQLWTRWAKGAASVEATEALREKVGESFRWLLDGYRYVPGGRIENMLGQEFAGLGLPKTNLSAYNCLVLPSPQCKKSDKPINNWVKILKVAKREANSMAFGCGVGLNLSTVPDSIEGPKNTASVAMIISSDHPEKDQFVGFSNVIDAGSQRMPHKLVVEDSRLGIFDALIDMVKLIYKGKDVALDFSKLRPKGALVKGINGVSSGAYSWAKLFDFVAGLLKKDTVNTIDIAELYAFVPHLISQGGQRRGALMEVLNVDHPNIKEFIEAKQTAGRITGANLSVNITDKFMGLVKKEDPYAVALFDTICEFAHRSAEPGVLFMDRAQSDSNTSYYQVIDAVNPCAEEPLPPNAVCNLAHLNLPRFLVKRNGKWVLDYDALAKAIKIGVRFNDNIIDYTPNFDDEIEAVQKGDRRIGIGTMGLATVLIYLGIKYGSSEAELYAEELNKFIAKNAYEASIELGKEKGSFPNYDPTKISKDSFLYRITEGNVPATLRNAALLTQAPTGSTGTMVDNLPGFDSSTGIEPYFAFEYYRASRLGTVKQEVELVKTWRKDHSVEGKLPDFFVGASDITPAGHVRMQGAIQKYVDAAISKTINLPNEATVQDVKDAYLLAYDLGCKGVTVYRDGSRSGQVLATKKEDAKLDELQLSTDKPAEVKTEEVKVSKPEFKKRSRILTGHTVKQNSPFGKMYVTINNNDQDDIEEVFIHLGKVGSDIRAIVDSLGILLTLSLSERLSELPQEQKLEWLIGKLVGIKGSNPIGFGPNRVDSLPDALGKVLKEYVEGIVDVEEAKQPLATVEKEINYDICPECGAAAIQRIEGCEKCVSCGASKCS